MSHLKDNHAIYKDGSIGGFANQPSLSAVIRNKMGNKHGKKDAVKIFESIMKEGKITETIKIITHSMGGAYGKGYVQALYDYCIENGIDPSVIEFEADFAPFQPTSQKAVKGVNTLQFSHSDDAYAGNKPIEGAKQQNTSSDKKQEHGISTFMDQIKNLPAGKYKVVDGKIISQ